MVNSTKNNANHINVRNEYELPTPSIGTPFTPYTQSKKIYNGGFINGGLQNALNKHINGNQPFYNGVAFHIINENSSGLSPIQDGTKTDAILGLLSK